MPQYTMERTMVRVVTAPNAKAAQDLFPNYVIVAVEHQRVTATCCQCGEPITKGQRTVGEGETIRHQSLRHCMTPTERAIAEAP